MNFFLSIILCIAMAASGTASLPAQPESMTRWTLHNLTIGNGGQSVSLYNKAVLRSAVSEDAAQLQFYINNGGEQALPVAVGVDEESIMMSFGMGTRAYSINYDALMEAAEIEEADLEFIDQFSAFLLDLGRLLALMDDPAQAQRVSAAFDGVYEGFYGEAKLAEVELDGVLYPAEYRKGIYNDMNLLKGLQDMGPSGIAELDAVMKGLVDMLCLAEGGGCRGRLCGTFGALLGGCRRNAGYHHGADYHGAGRPEI